MKTITIEFPDPHALELEYLVKTGRYQSESQVLQDALRQLMLIRPHYRVDIAVNLYIDEKISLGKAAEIAGVSSER